MISQTRVYVAVLGIVLVVLVLGIFGAIMLATTNSAISDLAERQEASTASVVVVVVQREYRMSGSWDRVDMIVPVEVAASGGAALAVRDAAGRPLPVPTIRELPLPAAGGGPRLSSAVVVDGAQVGTVILQFHEKLLPRQLDVRNSLRWGTLIAAGLAGLVGVVVALDASRRIGRPLTALTEAVESMAAGSRSVRYPAPPRRDEVARLGAAFNRMSDTITRQDEERRALTAEVAHELRTPLAVLQGTVEALADGLVPPSPEILATLHEEALQLGGLIDDLDVLAPGGGTSFPIDRAPIDLSEVTRSVANAVQRRFTDAGVDLVVHLVPAPAFADPRRARQIVTNLLSNALSFTPASGTVSVATRAEPDAAILDVTDNGIGIDPEHLPHIFEPSWTTRHGGTARRGLGLAVVQTLVAAHGGVVTVDSTTGKGTHFSVRFPRAVPPLS